MAAAGTQLFGNITGDISLNIMTDAFDLGNLAPDLLRLAKD
jgi:hypothetical protein